MMTEGYIIDFVTKAKEDGSPPYWTARKLLEKNMEDFATTLVRVLSDAYDEYKMEPWKLAHNIVWDKSGLKMSAVDGARAIKRGLDLDAAAMAKIFRKLHFPRDICKYLLTELRFSESSIEEAIESTYNVD